MSDGSRWIRDDRGLARFLDGMGRGPLAIDLEADSFHHYQEQVCLVQLSVDGTDRLVDPLAGVDLSRLRAVFEDRSVRKIFHGADYDLRLLSRDHGLRVQGLFDTMVAARLTGERTFGLAALLEREFDVRLNKSLQRADWSVRPLTASMERYAVEDTRHLEALADRLEERLGRIGRLEWALEEFERLETVRWGEGPSGGTPTYLRIKGARKLRPRALAVLRAVHEWRDRRARERDVPLFRVARDAEVVAITRAAPGSVVELGEIPGLPQALRRGALAREIVGAVRRGLEAPEERFPETDPSREKPDVPEAKLKRFRKLRDDVARRLDLDSALVCSRRVIGQIAERAERGDDWTTSPDLRRWQRPLVAPIVADVWESEPSL